MCFGVLFDISSDAPCVFWLHKWVITSSHLADLAVGVTPVTSHKRMLGRLGLCHVLLLVETWGEPRLLADLEKEDGHWHVGWIVCLFLCYTISWENTIYMYIYDIYYMIRCINIHMYVHICAYTHKIVVSVSKNWPQSIKGNATDTTLGSSSTSGGWHLAWWHAKQLMSTDAGGYVEPEHGDLIDISVQCLNGEGCTLKLSGSCTGLEVYRMVSNRLPGKKGGKPTLYHLDSPLILHKELQVQGIVGKAARLSCTYVPTDLYAAWCAVQEMPVFLDFELELVLEGVTQLAGTTTTRPHWSQTHVTLPSSLKSLTFGSKFDQCLQGVTLPRNL